MNKSLSLVIALTVVILTTVIITYFDILDMDKTIRKEQATQYSIAKLENKKRQKKPASPEINTINRNQKSIENEGKNFIIKAYLLYREGKLFDAEEKIRTALILLPNDENGLALLGRILYETGRYDLAEQVFREQVKKRSSITAYNNLGEAMARQGKYQTAIKNFTFASELGTGSATVNLNLAGLHSLSGNKKQALRFFRQAFMQLGYKIIPVAYDPNLENIRSEPEFKKIIKSAKRMQP